MSSTFGINYSTRVMSYGVGPPAAPADRAKHEQAAAIDLTSALLEAAYALAGELRGLGPVAHGLLRERQLASARERLVTAIERQAFTVDSSPRHRSARKGDQRRRRAVIRFRLLPPIGDRVQAVCISQLAHDTHPFDL